MAVDYKKYAVLYVDDEANSLKYFGKIFSSNFIVHCAENAAQGWELVQNHTDEIAVVLSDQRMPEESGVQLLKKIRDAYPEIVRILVTAFADIDSAVDGVNEGAIYKYISKPWEIPDLRITIMRAIDFYLIQKERNQLVKEKLSLIQRMFIGNHEKNLAILGICLESDKFRPFHGASDFIKAIPAMPVDLSKSNEFWRDMGTLPKIESDYIFQIVTEIRRVINEFDSENVSDVTTFFNKIPDAIDPSILDNIQFNINVSPTLDAIEINTSFIQYLITKMIGVFSCNGDQRLELDIRVDTETDGNMNNIIVQLNDNGASWSEHTVEEVFSPFSGNFKSGKMLGIDLLICYLLASHLGGQIQFINDSDIKFQITIPLNTADNYVETTDYRDFLDLFCHNQNWQRFL